MESKIKCPIFRMRTRIAIAIATPLLAGCPGGDSDCAFVAVGGRKRTPRRCLSDGVVFEPDKWFASSQVL